MVVLATAIDIGIDLDFTGGYKYGLRTYINMVNPANESGTITEVTIHAYWYNMTNCEVATFFLESGNNYSTRDYEYIGTVATGKHAFEVNLDVEAGDFIGLTQDYALGGLVWETSDGKLTRYIDDSDQIPCENQEFISAYINTVVGIYGTGTTEEEEEEEVNAIFFGTNF